MTEISLLNSKFEVVGTFQTDVSLAPEKINGPVVHQVVKSLLANRRQGNAASKNKCLVRGGGAKPFKQKGTGRARQGSSRSPLQVGGGSAFGPVPRSYEQKINKKMMLVAIQSVLADKYQAGKLLVLDEFAPRSKTKEMYKLLNGKGLNSGLIVTKNKDSSVLRTVKNIERTKGLPVEGFSVYEAVKYENLIIEKNALEVLLGRVNKLN